MRFLLVLTFAFVTAMVAMPGAEALYCPTTPRYRCRMVCPSRFPPQKKNCGGDAYPIPGYCCNAVCRPKVCDQRGKDMWMDRWDAADDEGDNEDVGGPSLIRKIIPQVWPRQVNNNVGDEWGDEEVGKSYVLFCSGSPRSCSYVIDNSKPKPKRRRCYIPSSRFGWMLATCDVVTKNCRPADRKMPHDKTNDNVFMCDRK